MLSRCRIGLALALTVASAALAQGGEVARKPTFARVETLAGAPGAGAVVTFAGCLPHVGAGLGPADVQVVQADARGRVQAKLVPGLCYVAWAVAPVGPDGAAGLSAVHGWFGCGALTTLVLQPTPPARRVTLRVDAGWREPVRWFARTPTPGAEIELLPDAEGRCELPVGPFRSLEARLPDGAPLWFAAIDDTRDTYEVPGPRPIPVRVFDAQRAPLANVVLRHRVGRAGPWRQDAYTGLAEDRWRDLGTTGAEGTCTVVVPYGSDPLKRPGPEDLLLCAVPKDRPGVFGGVFQRAAFRNDHSVATHGAELEFECRIADPLVGHVRGLPRGSIAHLAAVCKLRAETSFRHDARSFTAPVDSDGRFVFVDVPSDLHLSRLTLVAPEGAGRPSPCFAALPGRELPRIVMDGDDVLLAEGMADVTVQATEANGGPARGAIGYLVPAERGNQVLVRDSLLRVALDATGSARLRLQPGAWAFVVPGLDGVGAGEFTWEAGERTAALVLEPYPVMRVELRTDAGSPIRGAFVEARGVTMRGQTDSLRSLLQSLRVKLFERWRTLHTDEQGRATIPFLHLDGMSQKVGMKWESGTTADFALEANTDWLLLQPR